MDIIMKSKKRKKSCRDANLDFCISVIISFSNSFSISSQNLLVFTPPGQTLDTYSTVGEKYRARIIHFFTRD
jgi:hypothetical protein